MNTHPGLETCVTTYVAITTSPTVLLGSKWVHVAGNGKEQSITLQLFSRVSHITYTHEIVLYLSIL